MGVFPAVGALVYGIEQCPGALRLHWPAADAAASASPIPFDRPRAGATNLPVDYPTNRVLAALAHVDQRGWSPHLERVALRQGHLLLTPNTPIEFVYFPEDALVGLMHASGSGAAVPLALVGHDGVVGVAPLLGAPAEHLRAEVLHPGNAWRLSTEALNPGHALDVAQLRVLLRYLQALDAQIAQTALCQLQHPLHQRLGRWLQDAFDRVPGGELRMEPARLASWLGAEPGAVALATAQWVAEGALAQHGGRITLLDRRLLDRRSCGCHHLVKQQTDLLFPTLS